MDKTNDIRKGRHCVYDLHAHLVFVTKYRHDVFTGEHLKALERIFSDVCASFDCRLEEFNGETDHVHLLGYRDDAERIVTAFDVYLLTSLYEGLPYSLVESLRAGVPIVATNVTGSNEVVRPGVNGYLFEVGDVEDGARQVERIISERSRGGFSPDAVRGTYLDRFTSACMLDSVQQSYLD